MRTIIVLCSLLGVLSGCSGMKAYVGQESQSLALQGKQWLDQQRYNEAIAAYREAVRRDPRNAVLHYGLAVAYSRTGEDAQAITAYREVIRLQPNYADAHYGLGVVSERQGQDAQAIAAYREVIRLTPENAMAYYGLGVASGRQGQEEQAVSAYREAIRLNPSLADAYYNLGMVYARMRQDAQAIAACREAIRLQPTDALAHYGLGVAYSRTGEDAQAIAAYREAIRLQPSYADAYHSLGVIYAKQRQNDQALAAYREAIRLNPNHADAYTGLGVMYSRARQDAQAMEAYRQALRLNPNQPNAYYGLWIVYKTQRDVTEAQRAWQAYQMLVPGAGPEPDALLAQGETPEPSAPTAVEMVAVRPTAAALPPQPPAPVPSSPPPQPEPPRTSPERSAESIATPSLVAALPEPPAAPTPPPAPAPPPRAPETGVPALATSERRTALVIGNAAYRVDPLRNAVHDATDMAATLRRLGFQVTELQDAAHQQMEEGVEQFTRQLGRGGVGLFYYSGHGVQVSGVNYLIPVDARISRESDIKYQSVQVDWVLDRMREAGNELNVIVLDACRNNPYARSWRSAQPGLAVMQAASGSLIGYATSPGTTAEDGPGRNGTYTKHLLHFMQLPSLSAEQMFKEVRVAVAQETGKKQIPWVSTSILGDFYFAGK
jgi:tetratricopeptide (TPR) repeat protein